MTTTLRHVFPTSRSTRWWALLVAPLITSACAATTYDAALAPDSTTVVPTFTVPTGTTRDLLRELSTAMNGLSILIGPNPSGRSPAGKNERITEIEALWNAAQLDVTSADPEAADAIGRMVTLARTAVERNRPADADKAARFAGQVIDDYLSTS